MHVVTPPGQGIGQVAGGALFDAQRPWSVFATLPLSECQSGWPAWVLAGVLVGVATRHGSGCTNDHGGATTTLNR
ncbi:hypothetical protein PS663_01174 [Pseudomonas fluorescens]|nr:hypothetical protein PS663_01174 [Pseudomonas fluorescens]